LHLVAMQLARSSMSVGFYLVARARCLALDRAIHFYALLDCIWFCIYECECVLAILFGVPARDALDVVGCLALDRALHFMRSSLLWFVCLWDFVGYARHMVAMRVWSQLIALAHLLWIGGGDGGGYAHAPQHIWGLLLVSRDAGAYQSCNSSAMVLYYATILLLLLLAYFIASRITAALLWFVRAR
jgi:hypothetical protein